MMSLRVIVFIYVEDIYFFEEGFYLLRGKIWLSLKMLFLKIIELF